MNIEDDSIKITEIQIETSNGVTVRYKYDERKNSLVKKGTQYPKSWTTNEFGDENKQKLSDAELEGKIAGAKREADIRIAKEFFDEETVQEIKENKSKEVKITMNKLF